MKNSLKDSNKNCIVNLSGKDGSVYKRTLLCREGVFQGMYGECVVTPELLARMASSYNTQRANAQNENDYAPILLDHMRIVDNIKGRLMADLAVAPWVNPEDGQTYAGLYGDLRLDTPDAVEKVDQGIYSQVSLSFDEETGEIFEVSFVAVEAARRSQVLSKGEKQMDFEKEYQNLSATHATLSERMTALKAAKKASASALASDVEAVQNEVKSLLSQVASISLALKTASLGSQFKGFVRAGKMSLAEMKGLKVAELSSLPKTALQAVLASYEARAINPDFKQFGQADAKPINLTNTSPKLMAELIELQKSGKTLQSLSEAAVDDKAKEDEKEKLAKDEKSKEGDEAESELKFEDIEGAMASLDGVSPMIEKVSATMKKMGEMVSKLLESDDDKNEEKKNDDKKEGEE